MNLNIVQEQLIQLLDGAQTHITFEKVVEKFPIDKINTRIKDVPYSPWEIVEHMRITQRDILDYINGSDYKELKFPLEYWPAKGKEASVEEWNNSTRQIKQDLQELKKIVLDPGTDLTAPLSNNAEHNVFREILIMGNHNSYHTGQLLIFQRAFGGY